MGDVLNGQEIAGKILDTIAKRGLFLKDQTGLVPGLAVILVGENPASKLYTRRKIEACHRIGIRSFFHPVQETIFQEDLITLIHRLNQDPQVNGILLQLPLPDHLDSSSIICEISPKKDVDGLHPYNQGLLFQGRPFLTPCTPQGCIQLLHHCGTHFKGKKAVIVGRSILVGRPLAMMLTTLNATVTLAHSYTKDLENICRQADILITAVGQPGLITDRHVNPGAIVLDVGITSVPGGGKILGDVDFENVAPLTSFISPVPGGVGPMTIANLLLNTLKAAELNSSS